MDSSSPTVFTDDARPASDGTPRGQAKESSGSANEPWGGGNPSHLTLGVEEEYMLLDGESFDLVQHIDTVLAAISGHELETHINPELMQSVLEIATPVCRTAGDIDRELRRLRAYVAGIASQDNLRVGSAGGDPLRPLLGPRGPPPAPPPPLVGPQQ